jgi:hypothetical protein
MRVSRHPRDEDCHPGWGRATFPGAFALLGSRLGLLELSPFLLLDFGGPRVVPPTSERPLRVGLHPHRGFETALTIVYSGEVEHRRLVGPAAERWGRSGARRGSG